MPLKHYGIYISWAPTVDLRHEGLGRYLAAFVKGITAHTDVRFIIICPSWSQQSLRELFKAEAVPDTCFKLVSPKKTPPALRIFEAFKSLRKKSQRISARIRLKNYIHEKRNRLVEYILQSVAGAQSIPNLLYRLTPIGLLGAIGLALSPIFIIFSLTYFLPLQAIRLTTKLLAPAGKKIDRVKAMARNLKGDGLVLRMYQEMERSETLRMLKLANDLKHVSAWYCPTAFWPAFNELNAPRLMCVPDVVLSEFPVGFAKAGGDRFLQTFNSVETTIKGGDHFVTYSNKVKWATLVDKYGVPAANISVVHHAPNDLSRWVKVSGFSDLEATSINYCRSLMAAALLKARGSNYTHGFENTSLSFMFYASQLRPNKNVITLLRAYRELRDKDLIKQKLIITGDPSGLPEVRNYISEHKLETEVLCLHGLTVKELAACYKLADLAVNPSLSEGGCPFTFTEALSVDTPVIMARIPVTEEILTDPQLQEMTFFDPFDWRDLAKRIEWALANREHLLNAQRKIYTVLAKRTWADVVDEHLQILNEISQQHAEAAN